MRTEISVTSRIIRRRLASRPRGLRKRDSAFLSLKPREPAAMGLARRALRTYISRRLPRKRAGIFAELPRGAIDLIAARRKAEAENAKEPGAAGLSSTAKQRGGRESGVSTRRPVGLEQFDYRALRQKAFSVSRAFLLVGAMSAAPTRNTLRKLAAFAPRRAFTRIASNPL